LKEITLIRNGGRSFGRTHLGDVLNGGTLYKENFEAKDGTEM
jgi:hypothetical protein